MMVTSMPKYSASPPQTPAIIFCEEDLYNFFIVFPSFHFIKRSLFPVQKL
ncbi:PspC domain-containing protein [Listeria monocytogenes]|nr:PspC domain-containing protein [Listeria monocytogenes]